MAIKDYGYHGLGDETVKERGRVAIREAFERKFVAEGADAANAVLAKYGVTPSVEDVQRAERKVYEAVRDVNPFEAAALATRNPALHQHGDEVKAAEIAAVTERALGGRLASDLSAAATPAPNGGAR